MALVEGFAVVGVEAEADFVAAASRYFAEPVGIGKRLAGEADDVGGSVGEGGFRLFEVVDAASGYYGCGQRVRADRGADAGCWFEVAAEGIYETANEVRPRAALVSGIACRGCLLR